MLIFQLHKKSSFTYGYNRAGISGVYPCWVIHVIVNFLLITTKKGRGYYFPGVALPLQTQNNQQYGFYLSHEQKITVN
jgi:hypothetical protein